MMAIKAEKAPINIRRTGVDHILHKISIEQNQDIDILVDTKILSRCDGNRVEGSKTNERF